MQVPPLSWEGDPQPHPTLPQPTPGIWATCSLRPKPWFIRESASSLQSQQMSRSCTGVAGNWGHCGHWSAHGRPQPLTLFLLNLFSRVILSEMHTGPKGSWRLPWGQVVPRWPPLHPLQRRLLLTRSPTPWSLRLSCLGTCPHLPDDSRSCSPFCLLPPYLTHEFLGI